MPWKASDALKHTKKADTPAKQITWKNIANKERQRCVDEGGDAEGCDARAIRVANEAVANIKEGDMSYKAYTMSTNNVLIPVNAIDVDGEAIPVVELVAAYEEQQGNNGDLQEATTKTVDGKSYPASDFLVVEDSEKPTTWHLQVKRNGKPDHNLMGGAKAALTSPGGHRGNKYQGPSKQEAIRKLKTLYKSEDMAWDKETSEADIAKARELLEQALAALGERQEEITEADLCENVAFDTFMPEGDHDADILEVIEEAGITAGEGRRAPVVVDLQIIKPGPGNEKDNRYYLPATLKNYAHVFEGADIFVTDHKAKERSEKTKVGRIRECPVHFTEIGGPVGRTIVYDPDMAEKIRNRADADELSTLHCSILGTGNVRPGKVDGKKYGIVESINDGPLVEFVSKAGAGGHALNLAENNAGGVNMDKEKIVELLSESELPPEAQERLAGAEYEDEGAVKEAILQEKEQAQEQEEPQKLEEAEVAKLLSMTSLPSASKKRLGKGEYEDETALRESVLLEIEYVKTLTGSGQPFEQGPSQAQQETKPLSERLDAIDARYGLQAQGQEV